MKIIKYKFELGTIIFITIISLMLLGCSSKDCDWDNCNNEKDLWIIGGKNHGQWYGSPARLPSYMGGGKDGKEFCSKDHAYNYGVKYGWF